MNIEKSIRIYETQLNFKDSLMKEKDEMITNLKTQRKELKNN